jgi:hypothetical protein
MTFNAFPGRLVRSTVLGVGGALLVSCGSSPTGNSNDYELEIRYVGTPPTGATLTSFNSAFAKIDAMVLSKLSAVGIPAGINLEDDCGAAGADINVPSETHTGLVVYIQITPIDGVGGTLGSAGPCLVRPSGSELPVLGVMQLDAADVASLQTNGRLTTVVHHELLHVLGLGTLWADVGLLSDTTGVDVRYLGSRARTACVSSNGGATQCATNVPVHSDTAASAVGSSYAHWREVTFTNELMTPFLTAGATPYSAMTAEAMGDLGYDVSTIGTDAFTVSGTLLRMAPDADSPEAAPSGLEMPEPRTPRWTIGENGQLIPYRRN